MTQNLPSLWIERIFARLQGVYGREFIGQYSTGVINGVDSGIENAKVAWSIELAAFAARPDAIAYALENLPERAPNAVRFKELCRTAPRTRTPELEQQFTFEQVEANKMRVRELLQEVKNKTMVSYES